VKVRKREKEINFFKEKIRLNINEQEIGEVTFIEIKFIPDLE